MKRALDSALWVITLLIEKEKKQTIKYNKTDENEQIKKKYEIKILIVYLY